MNHVPSFEKVKALNPNAPCSQIWDCTDIFIKTPRSNVAIQRSTYSEYRGGHTLKALVSISPNGAIVYVSDLYSGGISDKEIVRQCGILTKLEPGDVIFADVMNKLML